MESFFIPEPCCGGAYQERGSEKKNLRRVMVAQRNQKKQKKGEAAGGREQKAEGQLNRPLDIIGGGGEAGRKTKIVWRRSGRAEGVLKTAGGEK